MLLASATPLTAAPQAHPDPLVWLEPMETMVFQESPDLPGTQDPPESSKLPELPRAAVYVPLELPEAQEAPVSPASPETLAVSDQLDNVETQEAPDFPDHRVLLAPLDVLETTDSPVHQGTVEAEEERAPREPPEHLVNLEDLDQPVQLDNVETQGELEPLDLPDPLARPVALALQEALGTPDHQQFLERTPTTVLALARALKQLQIVQRFVSDSTIFKAVEIHYFYLAVVFLFTGEVTFQN